MATQNDEVTKQSEVDDFNTTITDLVNSLIVWHSGNYPTNFPTGELGGTPPIAGPTTGDITDTEIIAATLASLFSTAAFNLTQVRRVRFTVNGGSPQTNITYLDSSYRLSQPEFSSAATTAGVLVGEDINAAAYNNFIDILNTGVTTSRNTQVNIDVTVCHSSCHGSCHGSRSRR